MTSTERLTIQTARAPAGADDPAHDRVAASVSPRISAIIPTRNEADRIAGAVEATLAGGVYETIVADGGSSDGTAAVARRAGARVLQTQPGRGTQMNSGAAAARGDILLFVHADTRLPEQFAERIAGTLERPEVCAGAFKLRIDDPRRSLRWIERIANWRSRVMQLPYGDQTLFITRKRFAQIGGFPDIPIMEDYVIVRRLRRLGRIAICEADALTSARRWIERGVWRTTWVNQMCVLAYLAGIQPERIAKLRDG